MASDRILTIDDFYVHPEEEDDSVNYIDYWKSVSPTIVDEFVKKYDIKNKGIDNACITCQITHIDKYKSVYPDTPKESRIRYREARGRKDPTHAWQISCPFIPLDYLGTVPKEQLKLLTEEEKAIINSSIDPVAFARRHFAWVARPHQVTMIRCQSKRKVIRAGRRTGKSEAMAVELLWHAMTKEKVTINPDTGEELTSGIKILIIAPYLAQVKEIYAKIKGFIDRGGKDYKDCIVRDVQTPNYEMKFSNGASIVGFTTGSKNTGDASTIRGQGADIIYIDEADYLGAGDFKALIPIFQDNPDVLVRASSTPSGKDLRFKEWCIGNPQWKEFYFPTPVLEKTEGLNWKRMRRESRVEFSFDEWQQEMMAIFVAGENAVFQPKFVAEAMADYDYEEMVEQLATNKLSFWRYSMGVDWNSNVGTEIVVVGYTRDETGPKFQVMETHNVPKQNFTQHMGLSEVIRLAKRWKPDYIYIDRGYGAVQYEMIRLWSIQQRPGSYERSIERRTKSYDFGSNIEIRDPATGKKIKHPAKSFMVENAVRKFEDSVIKFSSKDEKLRKQLLNYIVKNISDSGKKSYDVESPKIGDHCLDALMLSLVAWTVEEGVLNKGYYTGNPNVGVAASSIQSLSVDNSIISNNSNTTTTERIIPNIYKSVAKGGMSEIQAIAEERSTKIYSRNDGLSDQPSIEKMFPTYNGKLKDIGIDNVSKPRRSQNSGRGMVAGMKELFKRNSGL
jgi:replicative DNA helicase